MREKMITRSMKVTKANVLVVNITEETTQKMEVALPNVYTDAKLAKAIDKHFVGSNLKPVNVVSSYVEEKLFGLSENDFLKYAIELNPETRKPLDVATSEQATEE